MKQPVIKRQFLRSAYDLMVKGIPHPPHRALSVIPDEDAGPMTFAGALRHCGFNIAMPQNTWRGILIMRGFALTDTASASAVGALAHRMVRTVAMHSAILGARFKCSDMDYLVNWSLPPVHGDPMLCAHSCHWWLNLYGTMVWALNRSRIYESYSLRDVWIDLHDLDEAAPTTGDLNPAEGVKLESMWKHVFPSTYEIPRMGHPAFDPWESGFGNANWIEGGEFAAGEWEGVRRV